MLNRTRVILVVSVCLAVTMASAQAPCPGFDPTHNVNLACQIATTTRASTSGSQTLGGLSPTMASQLSELPSATVISGTGLLFGAHGNPTVSTDSLGTILTQRGETLGKKRFYLSFNYQRFGFDSIDGVSLKHLDVVNVIATSNGRNFVRGDNRIDLRVDQFVAVGSYGLTNRIDLSVFVPFAHVVLKTGSGGHQFNVSPSNVPISDFMLDTNFLMGSATGVGDVAVNLKANVVKKEKAKVALGGEVRFPTGDALNYLGSGAYGFKPYVVFSRRGRITPNINLGYQWNSRSVLFVNPNSPAQLNLPSSFLYSGGADYRVVKDRLTLNAELLGQYVINGPRLLADQLVIPGQTTASPTVKTLPSASYAMDNLGVGFKFSPFKGWLLTGNALIKLDDGGLRSKIVPLVGVSYKF